MEEIWRDIPEYKGIYQASNLGRIRGLNRIGKGAWGVANYKSAIRKTYIKSSSGYEYISLFKNGKRTVIGVHQLVLSAFVENKHGKDHVNHINKIRHDNRIENLEWVTPKENVRHSITRPVVQYDLDMNPIKIHKGIVIASETLGISKSGIQKCAKGKQRTCQNYIFKYL